MIDNSFIERRLLQIREVENPTRVRMGDHIFVVATVQLTGQVYTRVSDAVRIEHYEGDIPLQVAIQNFTNVVCN